MHDYPRQRLSAIIAQFGPQVAEVPAKLGGLLNDFLKGKYKLERSLLVTAAEERVPEALSTVRLPKAILFSQLVSRLQQDRALTAEAANWAVESWALALGVIDAPYQSPPGAAPSPAVTPGRIPHPDRRWAVPGYVLLLTAAAFYLTGHPVCVQSAWLCPALAAAGVAGVFAALFDTVWPAVTFIGLAVAGYYAGERPDRLLMVMSGLGASVSLIILVAVRARREPIPVSNARIRPETARQLQTHLRYYVGGHLLETPFAPLFEEYEEIRRTVNRTYDRQQLLLSATDILAVAPTDYSELEHRYFLALREYRTVYDRLIMRIVTGTPLLTNTQIMDKARIGPAFESTYTQRLAAAATELQARLPELVTQYHTLRTSLPRLHSILSRGGWGAIISDILELLPIYDNVIRRSRESERRFLVKLADELDIYLRRWESAIQLINQQILPRHQQIYDEIIQQSLAKITELFNQFDAANVPLQPLLRELRRSNKQAAKVRRPWWG